jgi:hypothetical protein
VTIRLANGLRSRAVSKLYQGTAFSSLALSRIEDATTILLLFQLPRNIREQTAICVLGPDLATTRAKETES